jgi:hypothetical protein
MLRTLLKSQLKNRTQPPEHIVDMRKPIQQDNACVYHNRHDSQVIFIVGVPGLYIRSNVPESVKQDGNARLWLSERPYGDLG